jgi:hypothetical protein
MAGGPLAFHMKRDVAFDATVRLILKVQVGKACLFVHFGCEWQVTAMFSRQGIRSSANLNGYEAPREKVVVQASARNNSSMAIRIRVCFEYLKTSSKRNRGRRRAGLGYLFIQSSINIEDNTDDLDIQATPVGRANILLQVRSGVSIEKAIGSLLSLPNSVEVEMYACSSSQACLVIDGQNRSDGVEQDSDHDPCKVSKPSHRESQGHDVISRDSYHGHHKTIPLSYVASTRRIQGGGKPTQPPHVILRSLVRRQDA